MTAVARALCALAIGAYGLAAGCSPVVSRPASATPPASRPAAAASAGLLLGPGPRPIRMFWASTAVSGHQERVLFAHTSNLGGRAVYYDTRDTARTVGCTAACTRRWLPLLESELGPGSVPFPARALSYLDGPDGRQVEYDGHPLYLYAGDSSNRWVQGSGNGADGTWFVVTRT